jgi:hypothetical protein
MTGIADGSVKIQTTSEANLSTPAWFGEVVLMSRYLQKHGVLSKITEQVCFARKRFGHYEIIDFLAVLFGYAISGERTLQEVYELLQPFAVPFMALFERDQLPVRSTLSRFLAALSEAPVEALRTLFLDDLLTHPQILARLHLPPDQFQQRPESQMVRSLYNCPNVPVGPEGILYRVVMATHPAREKKSPVGVTRADIVYELFFTNLPQHAFTACDVVELYLHRGVFEPLLSDEDKEQDPDRWCNHSAWGQEAWTIISQWVWNLRLELGHQLEPTPLRLSEFAPAILEQNEPSSPHPTSSTPASGYGPPTTATSWKTGRFDVQRRRLFIPMNGVGRLMEVGV